MKCLLRECATDKLTIAKLKINVKSLAEEARINRKEAAKLCGLDKHALDVHRTGPLREEARIAQWVYACARGVPRSVIESSHRTHPQYQNWLVLKAVKKAKRFGLGITEEDWKEWLDV